MRRSLYLLMLTSMTGAACASLEGPSGDAPNYDDGPNGGGSGGGEGGAPVYGAAESAPGVETVPGPDGEAIPGPLDACLADGLPAGDFTVLTAEPRSLAGFASAQFAKESIEGGTWPDPRALRLGDFIGYYADRLPIPADQDLEVRSSVAPTGPNEAHVELSVRLRGETDETGAPIHEPVHIVALTDISPSTGGSIGTRNGALDALATAMDTRAGDTLSIIAYGDPPELVFERAAAPEIGSQLDAAKPALAQGVGNDLIGAVKEASLLVGESESTHVVIFTDGGTKWNDELAASIDALREVGVVVSAAQIGRDVDADVPLFLNDDLLEGIARVGAGTRLYLPSSLDGVPEAVRIFGGRYEEIFSIADRAASLSIAIPSGLTVLDVPAETPQDGRSSGPVGYARPVGTSFDVGLECNDAFQSELAEFQVSLVTDSEELIQGAIPFSALGTSTPESAPLLMALGQVVLALRTRSPERLVGARLLVESLTLDDQSKCPEVDARTCSEPAICCVRAELLELVDGACALASCP